MGNVFPKLCVRSKKDNNVIENVESQDKKVNSTESDNIMKELTSLKVTKLRLEKEVDELKNKLLGKQISLENLQCKYTRDIQSMKDHIINNESIIKNTSDEQEKLKQHLFYLTNEFHITTKQCDKYQKSLDNFINPFLVSEFLSTSCDHENQNTNANRKLLINFQQFVKDYNDT